MELRWRGEEWRRRKATGRGEEVEGSPGYGELLAGPMTKSGGTTTNLKMICKIDEPSPAHTRSETPGWIGAARRTMFFTSLRTFI